MSQVTVPPARESLDGENGGTRSAPPRRGRRGSLTRDILEVGLLAVALYVVITFALQTVRVEGTSMVPTLGDGDLLFADKVSYHLHAPSRGDIVILIPPDDPAKDFIKRVVGLPGDHVRIVPDLRSADGSTRAAVEIKPGGSDAWQVLQEPYLPDQRSDPWTEGTICCDAKGHAGGSGPQELIIPQDQYFVLGDNRNASKDSRAIGLIPRANILGRAWVRIWPLSRFGFPAGGGTLTAMAVLPLPLLRIRRRRREVRQQVA